MAVHLSTREFEILRCGLQSLKNPDALQVDYDKLAQLAGFANARSANSSFGLIRKKLMKGPNATDDDAVNGEPSTPVQARAVSKKQATKANGVGMTPAKKGNAKRKAAEMDTDDVDTTEEPSPAKPKRKYNRKAKDSDVVDATEEPLPAKPKRTYNRKAKESAAPSAAKVGKKATKSKTEPVEDSPSAQLKTEENYEDDHKEVDQSAVIDAIIKEELGDDESDEEDVYGKGVVTDVELLGEDIAV